MQIYPDPLEPDNGPHQGKSLTHTQIQQALQKMLEPEVAHLEQRFPEIGRIADLVWPAQKLVFEIQVSPISAFEVKARNRDYQKMGYRVVWILHDQRFNRSRLTPAEIALRFSPHYFTNINELGKGIFYDQLASIRFKRRRARSPRMPVHFKRLALVETKQLSRHFPLERKKWPISFGGDLFHRDFTFTSPRRKLMSRFFACLRIVHHLLLEKTTY